MKDLRQNPRIQFEGKGSITLSNKTIPLETVNLSKGGGCFQVSSKKWPILEDLNQVSGKFFVEEHEVQFEGRVCWSSEGEAGVQFGVQFTTWDAQHLEAILIQSDQAQSENRQDSFNI